MSASLMASGCGDPLLGRASLDVLLPDVTEPTEISAMTVWYGGPDAGSFLGCDIEAVELDFYEDEGIAETPFPTLEPPLWVDVPGGRYALGMRIYVEGGTRPALDSILSDLWGVSDDTLYLEVEGDPAATADALRIDEFEGALQEGQHWLFANDAFGDFGTFGAFGWEGVLYTGFPTFILPVYHRSIAYQNALAILSGDAPGGISTLPCN